MSPRSTMRVLTLMIAVFALSLTGPVLAQERGGDGGGDRPRMSREQWESMSEEEREAFREEMRARMAERQAEREQEQRKAMEMSEEEWELIGPKIIAIRQMQQQRQIADGRGFGGRGGPQGGDQQGGRGGFGNIELSEDAVAIQEASTELRELLEDEAASSDEIKDALKALRNARNAMDTKIKQAQEDLRGLLTTKQEAMLVAQGVLS